MSSEKTNRELKEMLEEELLKTPKLHIAAFRLGYKSCIRAVHKKGFDDLAEELKRELLKIQNYE